MKKIVSIIITLAMILTLMPAAALANDNSVATLYVDDDWTAGSVLDEGKVWGTNAFATIQDAVDKVDATKGLTTINVAAGTYNGNITLNKNNVKFTDDEVDRYGNIEFLAEEDATVTLTGYFTFGNDSVNNIANLTVSGFTCTNEDYLVYFMNSGGTTSNVVITDNTITDGQIYINSGVVDNVQISNNNVTENDVTYCLSLGGTTSIIKNTIVSNNVFNGKYVGIFGMFDNGGIDLAQNTFNITGYLWINNGKAQNVGEITLSENKFNTENPVLAFDKTYTVKSDIVIGEGNTCNSNAVEGWAEIKADTEIQGIDPAYDSACYYNGKLYLGDEPAPPVAQVIDNEGKPVGENDGKYTTLAQAIDAVQSGQTIILLRHSNVVTDYTENYGGEGYSEAAGANRLIIGADGAKNFTLDLNGKTLTGRINFVHGNLTVKNGKIRSISQAINIFGSKNYEDKNTNYTVVTIESDVEITSDVYGVCVFGGNPNSIYWPLGFGEVVNFYGKVTAPVGIGNSGNIGMDTYEENLGKVTEIENLITASDCNSCSELMAKYGPVLNFYDGAVVNATEQAVYWPGLGIINVKGGSITGTEAIGIKGGIVNVSGGILTANGPKCNPVAAVNSGEEASGAAISISTYYNANYPITVNISGGTLRSTNNVALLVAHSVKSDVPTKVTKGINLTVSGGKFSGNSDLGGVYVEKALEGEFGKYPTKFITGGLFDKNVEAYVADGYVCVALATTDSAYGEGYRYIVKPADIKIDPVVVDEKGNITVGGETIEVQGAGDEGQPTAQEAAEAINETLNNPEVTGFDDTKIEEATPVNETTTIQNVDSTGFNLSMILDAVKTAAGEQFKSTNGEAKASANGEITVKTTDEGEGEKFNDENVTKQITVDLTAATVTKTVAQATTTTVTSMTFEVKPVAIITVTNGDETQTVSAVIPNEAITSAITFRLPVESSITEKWAAVYHKGEFMGNYEIMGTAETGKYIEISSNKFSEFKYVLINAEDATASIGDIPYQTLAEAITAVKNNETITLLKDASEGTITVPAGSYKFTLNKNGKSLSETTIVAPTGYRLGVNGDVYTVAKKSSGGGSSTPAKKEEKINPVSDYATCKQDGTCPMHVFADLNCNDWYHDGIHFCLDEGLMKGIAANKFDPTGNTSRAMMMTIVARMGGEKCDSVGPNWYLDGVNYVKANKISDGSRPTDMITREEFAVMLYNFAKTQGKGFKGDWVFPLDFKDANKVSDDAYEAMCWCVMNKILNGRGGIYAGMLDPKGLLTRAEASAMIQRYYEVK